MSRTPDQDPAHDKAHHTLLATLTDHIDSGRTIPCTQPSTKNWWTSEFLCDQEAAAWLCHGCPALVECGIYITAHPERAGVWAASTPSERSRGAA